MKIAYNPIGATALTTVPNDYVNDILFDLVGLNIFAKGTKFKGTDTTYLIFKKHTSNGSGGYNGLVPVPSYTTANNRYLREDGTWQVPSQYSYALLNNTDLNTLKTEGRWYYISGNSNNTNGPEGLNTGSELYIGRNANGYRYLKVITLDGKIWFRIWNSSKWGDWTEWNTDYKVLQSATTASTFRPVILGYKNSTSVANLDDTTTLLVYTTTKIYALPSTGTLYATKFQGAIDWSNITNKPSSFTPSSHTHPSNQITALTGYTKGTSDSALTTSDSLNTALGKLEYKGDLGVSAYNIVSAATNGDGTIENLNEILEVLQGISDTDTIKNLLGKYLPLAGGTMANNAFISWPDSGLWGQEGATYPLSRGGFRWTGTSDNITLYAEEVHSDLLDLILKLGDDSNPALSIRDKNNAEMIRLGVNGTITATKLVKRGGAATQILMADGSVKNITDYYTKTEQDHRYVNVSGDRMEGPLHFANRTENVVGDDISIGDIDRAGVLGLKGRNGDTGIMFLEGNTSNAWADKTNSYEIKWNKQNMVSSSTSLWQNLNADLLDGWHQSDIVCSGYVTSSASLSSYWFKLWDITYTSMQDDLGMVLLVHSTFNQQWGILTIRIRPNAKSAPYNLHVQLNCIVGNLSEDCFRLYYNNESGYCQLWADVGSIYGVYNYKVLACTHRRGLEIKPLGHFYNAVINDEQTLPSDPYVGLRYNGSVSQLHTSRTIWGKPFNGTANISGDMSGVGTINMYGELKGTKKIFLNTGDSTLKVYTGRTADGQNDGSICFQTSIDGTDGETHTYPTAHGRRCNIVLQPRGGQVYIGENPATGNTSAKLHVAGNVKATTFIGALQGNADSATKLQTKRTLWGQQFDGTSDVSGNMTGVGSITAVGQSRFTYNGGTYSDPASGVNSAIKIWGGLSQSSGDVLLATSSGSVAIGTTSATEKLDVNGNAKVRGVLKIGNSNTLNYLAFSGTTGDGPNSFSNTWIAERIWEENERSELVLFKGNDLSDSPNTGPDRIRHIASSHLFQVYTSALAGAPDTVCNSTLLKNVFQITGSSATSYIPLTVNGTITASRFISNITTGTAPLLITSTTLNTNLNADMLDGYHASSFMRMLGFYFTLHNLGTYLKILEFVIPSATTLNSSISFVWQPCECARNVWSDFNINIRSGDVIFLANWKGVDRRNLWCVKNEDGVTYSVWVLGSKSDYDPYGVILVIHAFHIKSYEAGSLAYSDEAPTGKAATTTGWALRVVGTLTMSAGRFTANTFNGSTNTAINIPTNTSHLTNDSGFWTGTKYWANVEVSSTSNVATTPTFAMITTSGDINTGGLLKRAGKVSTWVEGRNNALIRNTTYTGYNPILSMKTTNGSWELGVYLNDILHLTYITDTNYNSDSNVRTWGIDFPKKSGVVALTSDITNSYWANIKISNTSNANTNPTFGNTIINGQLYIASNQDASTDKNGALVIGSKESDNIAIDNNEIMARKNSVAATLNLNIEGGLVQIGTGGLNVNAAALAIGFKKTGSSDSYILLGGGGHKAITDFMLKSDELNANITTIEKTLTVTSEWMDTGISGNLLASGSYIVLLRLEGEYYTGVMSWYSDNTNNTESDEIILHRAGEAWANAIYLRTCLTLTDNGGMKLLIAANTNLVEGNYVFKFKRMI